MRHLLIFLFFATLATAAPAQSKQQRQIEALERQRFEAMTQQNTTALEKLLDESLTYGHSNGLFEDKATHLANIRTGSLVYKSMQPESMSVRVYKKTAIVNGLVKVGGTLKGKDFELKLRYTDVYLKKKGQWRLAAWQSVKAE